MRREGMRARLAIVSRRRFVSLSSQNDPNIEPSARTAARAMITLTITVITMSR